MNFIETLVDLCKNEEVPHNKKYGLIVAYSDAERTQEIARFGSFAGAKRFLIVDGVDKILENRSITGAPYKGNRDEDCWWRVVLATDEENEKIRKAIKSTR